MLMTMSGTSSTLPIHACHYMITLMIFSGLLVHRRPPIIIYSDVKTLSWTLPRCTVGLIIVLYVKEGAWCTSAGHHFGTYLYRYDRAQDCLEQCYETNMLVTMSGTSSTLPIHACHYMITLIIFSRLLACTSTATHNYIYSDVKTLSWTLPRCTVGLIIVLYVKEGAWCTSAGHHFGTYLYRYDRAQDCLEQCYETNMVMTIVVKIW
jgi:hypothetical protein